MATVTSPLSGAYAGLPQTAQYEEVRTATFTGDGSTAGSVQNDVIQMISVYPGDVVMSVSLDYAALGASSALEVGDGGSATRFIGSTATTSAGTTNSSLVGARAYKYTVDDTIDVLVSGSGAITGAVKVTARILRTFS